MRIGTGIRRLLVPGWLASPYYFRKFGAFVSSRTEVEISLLLMLGCSARIDAFTKVKATEGPVKIGAGAVILDGADIGDGATLKPRSVISGRAPSPRRAELQDSIGIPTPIGAPEGSPLPVNGTTNPY